MAGEPKVHASCAEIDLPAMLPLPLRILGTGRYLPRAVLVSEELDARWGRPPGTAFRQVGVRQRHVAAADESSSFMAARAAEHALAAAGLRADNLDAIVSASAVMEQAIPCLGAQVQREMGLGSSGIPAFDVNATCLSFLVALDLVASMLAAGRWRRALIVSSEMPSVGLNPNDPSTAALFGDGAAAVVVDLAPAGSGSALLGSHFVTYGDGSEHCQIRGGGTRAQAMPEASNARAASWFEMDGPATYRLAARHFPAFLDKLLQQATINLTDIDCIVPHQASGRALDHLGRSLGVAASRIVRTLPKVGNQVAASLPNALHEAIMEGRVHRGGTVALLGSGAGLSIGGVVLRY
jgi:3-oxoacyl-[acyl-carrier-protein] synthase-3